jgi:hypothetical protein
MPWDEPLEERLGEMDLAVTKYRQRLIFQTKGDDK